MGTCRRVGARLRHSLAVTGTAALCAGTVLLLGAPAALALGSTTGLRGGILSAAVGTGDATVSGTLVIGTTKAPAAGIAVTLHGNTTGSDTVNQTAVTSADGKFAFPGLSGGSAWTYTVTAPYSGVSFSSDVVQVDAGANTALTLSLYDTTPTPAAITVPIWTVWLDVEGDRMAVQQDVQLVNSGTTAYAGSDPVVGVPGNNHAAVTLPVAPSAGNLEYLGRFEVCCGALSGLTWSHTRPVSPGDSTGTLRYEAPFTATLNFPARFATAAFTLLVPEGTAVSSPQLTKQSGTSEDRGITYLTYTSPPLSAGAVVTVTLTPASTGPNLLLWGAIIGVLLLVAVVVAILIVRRRNKAAFTAPPAPVTISGKKHPAPNTSKTNGKTTAKATGAKSVTTKAANSNTVAATPATQHLDEHPNELADELAMLDLAFENGALPDEAAYRRVRESLLARLLAAVGDDPAALDAALNRP